MTYGKPTRFGEIANLSSPASAPLALRLSSAMQHEFTVLRFQSYPGGYSKERGCTIVADTNGILSLQNIGGDGSESGRFFPKLAASPPAKFKVVGTFHTHPYDRTEGSYNGVSFSGGDIGALVLSHIIISIVQSGPRLFAYVRTAKTPSIVDYTKLNNDQNAAIQAMRREGRTFQQASRILAERAAEAYGLAYYQGVNGVMNRVSPR